MSLFLGMDSNEERIDGKPLNDALGEISDLTSNLSYNPLVIMLGAKAVHLKLNADCRRLVPLREATKKVLAKYVRKYMCEYKEKKDKHE